MSGIVAGELLDEEHLYTNAPQLSASSYYTGNTSSNRQVVVVSPTIAMDIFTAYMADNHLKLDVYRADIHSDGSVSDWTKVLSDQDYNDENRRLTANIDATAANADTDLTSAAAQPFAIAWKFVSKPYSPGWPTDDEARCRFWWGDAGIQSCRIQGGETDYASVNTYDDNYKGKKLLILKNGFRVAYTGAYKDDHPANYVTFERTSYTFRDIVNKVINLFGGDEDANAAAQIGAGDTVVYLPTGA